jgi:hypothetical protein
MLTTLKKFVPLPVKEFYHRLVNPLDGAAELNPDKLALVERAVGDLGARTVADLGGVWRVNGGYSFHAAGRGAERVKLVDLSFTPEARRRQKKEPRVELVTGNFGLRETAERVGPVDAALLFDVLLHQVRPDWDEVLANWAPHVRHFVVYNQQYTGPQTVRLLDLGRDEYFKHTPHDVTQQEYRDLFERPDEAHPFYADGRTYRDQHGVWQWGITDEDLRRAMKSLGFAETFYKDCGPWPGLKDISNRAFVFSRG